MYLEWGLNSCPSDLDKSIYCMYSSCAVFKNVGDVKTLHSSRYRVFNCYDFKFVIFNCKPGLLAVLAVRVSCLLLCCGSPQTVAYPGVASQHKLNVLQATTRSMATVSIWPLPATANTTTSISSNSSPTITTTPPTTTTTTPTRCPPPPLLLLLVGQLDSTTVRAAATAAVELAIQPIGKKIDIF